MQGPGGQSSDSVMYSRRSHKRDRIGILSPPDISRRVSVNTSGALQLLLNQVFIAGTGRTEFRLCHVFAEITQKRDRIGILFPPRISRTVFSSINKELYCSLTIKYIMQGPGGQSSDSVMYSRRSNKRDRIGILSPRT